jgi:sugar lactone lactonase YvrE
MPSTTRTTPSRRSAVLLAGAACLVLTTVPPAAASPETGAPSPEVAASPEVIVLPGASSAEGIARGEGSTFYAGDLFLGDVFRGDLETGTAELFIDAPDGRLALGMAADTRRDLLVVAGGFTGQAYVYDLSSGDTVATYQFAPPSPPDADPPTTLVNDVALTGAGAWFTDSRRGVLYFVPIDCDGHPGEFRTLTLHGPAADTSGLFNLNGIAAARHGETLVVANTAQGELYTADPETGDSAVVAGVSVPAVDGIVLDHDRLWAVQNGNQVTEVRLNADLTAGRVEEVITSDLFQVPTTAIRYEGRLAVVNAKFDTGIPPTAEQYEVVLVHD